MNAKKTKNLSLAILALGREPVEQALETHQRLLLFFLASQY
jgi:hypothetical protein